MTKKGPRIDPDQLEQMHAIRVAEKMAKDEEIERQRRQMQKCNADHMELILDGIADHGIEIIKHPINQQSSRTIGNQLVTYHSRIYSIPNPQ